MFMSNPAKDLLRRKFDVSAISKRFSNPTSEVVYFGLPGPRMLDVKEWNDYIDYIIAVENDPEAAAVIGETATSFGLEGRLQILEGDIESILIDWHDIHGQVPERDSFDIVNLDLIGGFLGFGGLLQNKRINAISELFRHQKSEMTSFILFLTISFREDQMQEYDKKLHQIRKYLERMDIDANDAIKWYLSHKSRYKLKVYVPYLMSEIALSNRFRLDKYWCFYYRGSGNVPMMHFILDFDYCEDSLSPSSFNLLGLLNCPLFIAYPDRVEVCQHNPPQINTMRI